MKEYILIAKVLSSGGNDGFVKVSLFTDFPRRLFDLKKVYIDFFNVKKEIFIDKVKNLKGEYYIKFVNFSDAKDTDILLGRDIFIENEDLIELPDNSYFIHDLIGSVVLRNNEKIGKITDVLCLPANDVYIVEDESGNEILIPAVNDFIYRFDAAGKILYLMPGEDLYSDED